ncbi:MAG: molybdopterin molybdenumtransferase MoeA, partial [Oscillospiraceae bacterium]
MIQIEDCLKLLQDSVRPIEEAEYVPLSLCLGRIAAEDVRASLAVPPFPRSAVDGYAVRAEDTSPAGPGRAVRLKVNGKITAGEFEDIAFSPGSAVRVMTGAYIPQGYD